MYNLIAVILVGRVAIFKKERIQFIYLPMYLSIYLFIKVCLLSRWVRQIYLSIIQEKHKAPKCVRGIYLLTDLRNINFTLGKTSSSLLDSHFERIKTDSHSVVGEQ